MGKFLMILITFVTMIVALVIVATPEPIEDTVVSTEDDGGKKADGKEVEAQEQDSVGVETMSTSDTSKEASWSFFKKCEHDRITYYSFASVDSTAHSDVQQRCKKCNIQLAVVSIFKGTPIDQSYLEAIKEHSDGTEIVPGEYYTVTAVVPLGYYGYFSDDLWLNCRVENEDFVVGFNVEFREEFTELVKSVEKGDEITFRGRFYDEGCGFTDCELIIS